MEPIPGITMVIGDRKMVERAVRIVAPACFAVPRRSRWPGAGKFPEGRNPEYRYKS